MARAFAPIPAKPTFGTLRKDLYQSDYLARKTGALIYCNSRATCGKLRVAKDFREKLLFSKGKDFINGLRCSKFNIPVGKSNLIMGQYTKLNLDTVCPVINIDNGSSLPIPTQCYDNDFLINPITNEIPNCGNVRISNTNTSSTPFYQLYYIDPCGKLFGNSQCGELNYTSYMVINPPINPVL
jgi:hypothetical protein